MRNISKFLKIPWKRDFIISFLIFVILTFIFTFVFDYLIITPQGLPLKYMPIFYIPIMLIIWCVFLIGLVSSFMFPPLIGGLSRIFSLNDFSFSDSRSKLHIVYILFATSLFLIFLYIYFISLKIYEPIKTLLLSWMVLIFIRSAHYVNPKLGNRIGTLVVSFFIPFGLFILAINLLESGLNFVSDIYQTGLFILYFIIILSAQIPMEILMEYTIIKNKQTIIKRRQKELKSNWQESPYFVKYKSKEKKER